MTNIWLGHSTCYLQAYPSRLQKLFSWRKGNVPSGCFLVNNLRQESSIALLPALCQETRPTILNGSFSRFKQAKSYLHMPALFEPTQGCHKTVTASKGLWTPWSISAALCQHWKAWWSLLPGTSIFVSWMHLHVGHPSKEINENQSLNT